jgi:predicted SPOUT superfamily RNA methylase MTH1
VAIDKELDVGARVTVKLNSSAVRKKGGGGGKQMRGEAVAPSVPRSAAGLYWGYTVRLADTFSAVFTNSPHQGGYDMTIGTSERGDGVDCLTSLPPFQHLLIVFGGLKGLEHALDCDDTLTMGDVSLLFHHYLNTCPAQGSRTIRTEEAILISLAALHPLIKAQTSS